MEAPQLVNTIRGIATTLGDDASWSAVWEEAEVSALRKLPQMSLFGLTITARSLAQTGRRAHLLYEAISSELCLRREFDQLPLHQLSGVAWAYAKASSTFYLIKCRIVHRLPHIVSHLPPFTYRQTTARIPSSRPSPRAPLRGWLGTPARPQAPSPEGLPCLLHVG